MARITGIGETITALPRGFLNHLASGPEALKNWLFAIPSNVLEIMDQAGMISKDCQPMASRAKDITGTGATLIDFCQGVEKLEDFLGALRNVGREDLFHDITDLTSKGTDLISSGLEGASFVAEGAVLNAIKIAGSSLLGVGMACLSLNQGQKLLAATALNRALQKYSAYLDKNSVGDDGIDLRQREEVVSGYMFKGVLEGKSQLLQGLKRQEIKDIQEAVATTCVHHYLKIAQWVSLLALGVVGVLSLVFGMVLSPWFALMFSASALFFSLISGLYEHIHVKAAYEDLNENQMKLVKEFAPKSIKEAFEAHENKWALKPA
jgi:hypothetical protein